MGCGNSAEKGQPLPHWPAPIKGQVYFRQGRYFEYKDYEKKAYQYATTSYPKGAHEPAAIVYAEASDDHADVVAVLKYAASRNLAVSVRSGGHCYVGASSTGGDNIQIDMSKYVFTSWDKEAKMLKVGPGTALKGMDLALQQIEDDNGHKGTFVPHGACQQVAIGGHCQTSGYSDIARSFGLLVDHIQQLDVVLASGEL